MRSLNYRGRKKKWDFCPIVNNVIKMVVRKDNRAAGQFKSFVRRIFVSLIGSSMFQKYNGYSVLRKRNTDTKRARVLARILRDRNKWEYSTHSILFPLHPPSVGPVFVLFSRRAFPLVLPLWVTTPVRLCNAHVRYILWQMYKDLSLAISPGKSRATRASPTVAIRSCLLYSLSKRVASSKDMRFWVCRDVTIGSTHLPIRNIFSLVEIARINDFATVAWSRDNILSKG